MGPLSIASTHAGGRGRWFRGAAALFVASGALAAVAAPAADAPAGALPRIRVREGGWDGAPVENIRRVLVSAARELRSVAPSGKIAAIEVRHSKEGPMVLHQRGKRGQIIVLLDVKKTYWAQYAYQFAHEFGHILCQYRKGRNANKWFEEAVCEAASLYAMPRMAQTWKTRPPYPNWKSFAPHLKTYVDKIIAKQKMPDTSLAQWYRANAASLRKNGVQRDKNRVVSLKLLELIAKTPKHLDAIRSLNSGERRPDATLREHLQRWHDHAPAEHRPFIADVAALFDYKLAKAPTQSSRPR